MGFAIDQELRRRVGCACMVRCFPTVQVSEFGTWTEVAAWGERLFAQQRPVEGPVRAWVKKELGDATNIPAFIQRATRFVQDEIRYVGIEVGALAATAEQSWGRLRSSLRRLQGQDRTTRGDASRGEHHRQARIGKHESRLQRESIDADPRCFRSRHRMGAGGGDQLLARSYARAAGRRHRARLVFAL